MIVGKQVCEDISSDRRSYGNKKGGGFKGRRESDRKL